MRTILIVDDELQILKSLKRVFIETDYRILCEQSGEAALELLKKESVDLIISDMRMPGMDGCELLNRVKERYPKIFRMVLSGNSDEKLILKSVQKGVAKIYLMKPWKNDELIRVIDQIFETERLLNDKNLLTVFNNISELPTFKTNYQKIIEMTEKDADLSDIAAAIELDQSISSKILHIANSAYFGLKTGSVKQAVVFLGLDNIRSLVISTSFFDSMMIAKHSKSIAQKLLNHAYLTNRILLLIYQRHLHKEIPDEANAAGLLHNIGMIFMLHHFSSRYGLFLKKSILQERSLIEQEKQAFSISHAQAGGFLLRWWEIPYPIVESAIYCHQPMNESIIYPELVHAVHIAQKYACELLQMELFCGFYEDAFLRLGINRQEFENSLNRVV